MAVKSSALPAGGETVGRDNIAAALRKIRECFDYLLYRPLHVQAKDDVVRFQVEFMYRHRQSGETLVDVSEWLCGSTTAS